MLKKPLRAKDNPKNQFLRPSLAPLSTLRPLSAILSKRSTQLVKFDPNLICNLLLISAFFGHFSFSIRTEIDRRTS